MFLRQVVLLFPEQMSNNNGAYRTKYVYIVLLSKF